MYVICVGGQRAAKERLRKAGWSMGTVSIGGAAIEAASKLWAIVAFEPGKGDDGFASEPGTIEFGFTPLKKNDQLREEAMNCLSGLR